MQQAVQERILRLALLCIANGTPDMAAEAHRVPVKEYADELNILRRYPQPVGAASDVTNPGDWIARSCMGMPVLITRDCNGALRAYLNVCRHRGMQLVDCGRGSNRFDFSCPYHAWRYDNTGLLKNIPKSFGFHNLPREDFNLVPLAAEERAGLIWVIAEPRLRNASISALLGPYVDELEGFGFCSHVGYAPRSFSIASHWKLLADGSLEDYHFQVLHQKTSAPLFLDTSQLTDNQGLHFRFFLVQRSLTRAAEEGLRGSVIRTFGNFLYFFFSSTWFLVQPDHAMVTFTTPTDVRTTMLEKLALIPKEPDENDRAYWD
ncbi:MAG: hypothetical protein CBCREVIR_3677 [Candidatus Burkholderia crenata]|nr:MAG: hypothetical protein CBCREVIR_3677 [Candidatus Burkholderia crenata]